MKNNTYTGHKARREPLGEFKQNKTRARLNWWFIGAASAVAAVWGALYWFLKSI